MEFKSHMAKKSKRQKYKPWTDADLRAIKKYSRDMLPVTKIAKLMKRTVGTLRQKAFALGISLGHQRRQKTRKRGVTPGISPSKKMTSRRGSASAGTH
jgi:hypothetical protein